MWRHRVEHFDQSVADAEARIAAADRKIAAAQTDAERQVAETERAAAVRDRESAINVLVMPYREFLSVVQPVRDLGYAGRDVLAYVPFKVDDTGKVSEKTRQLVENIKVVAPIAAKYHPRPLTGQKMPLSEVVYFASKMRDHYQGSPRQRAKHIAREIRDVARDPEWQSRFFVKQMMIQLYGIPFVEVDTGRASEMRQSARADWIEGFITNQAEKGMPVPDEIAKALRLWADDEHMATPYAGWIDAFLRENESSMSPELAQALRNVPHPREEAIENSPADGRSFEMRQSARKDWIEEFISTQAQQGHPVPDDVVRVLREWADDTHMATPYAGWVAAFLRENQSSMSPELVQAFRSTTHLHEEWVENYIFQHKNDKEVLDYCTRRILLYLSGNQEGGGDFQAVFDELSALLEGTDVPGAEGTRNIGLLNMTDGELRAELNRLKDMPDKTKEDHLRELMIDKLLNFRNFEGKYQRKVSPTPEKRQEIRDLAKDVESNLKQASYWGKVRLGATLVGAFLAILLLSLLKKLISSFFGRRSLEKARRDVSEGAEKAKKIKDQAAERTKRARALRRSPEPPEPPATAQSLGGAALLPQFIQTVVPILSSGVTPVSLIAFAVLLGVLS
ncbi:MAG TPA: hypothetical protein PKL97_10215, partial [Candidatus Omnitrophota bacterium]|nr:hypothetical protein [Candidatus Omnitrophota bacterium]